MRALAARVAILSLTLLAASCNDDEPSDKPDAEETDGPYLPWKVGNSWTYRVTNNGEVSTKVVTIEAEEEVGGTGPHASDRAYRVVTSKGAKDQTVSWQVSEGDRVLRYREQSFHESTGELEQEEHWDPYKLHFDGTEEHTAKDADWLEVYEETKIPAKKPAETEQARDRWSVDSPSETVTVPAGTFRAVVVQKASGSGLKTYWYVRGVGKVKETGGQTEELIEYKVEP